MNEDKVMEVFNVYMITKGTHNIQKIAYVMSNPNEASPRIIKFVPKNENLELKEYEFSLTEDEMFMVDNYIEKERGF